MNLESFVATLPRFSQIKIETIELDLDRLIQKNLQKIDDCLRQPGPFTWENLMQPLEDMDDEFNQFWSPIAHLNGVMNSDALREVYERCLPKLSDYSTHISHNRKLYEAIQSIADTCASQLNPEQKKVIENNLRDFKLAGVSLPPDKKERYAQISKTLSELSNKFENNILDATKAWTRLITDITELAGVPELMQPMFAAAAQQVGHEGWLVTLDMPSYFAIITYAHNRDLRRDIYEAYSTRASDQGPYAGQWDNTRVMHDILKNRLALANLLDFNNYAEKSLATKMVQTTEQVLDFLNELVEASLPKAQQEFKALQAYAQQELGITDFQAWDVAYASEKLRESRYAFSQEEVRPYFPEQQVIQGLFTIVNKLFGVRVQQLEGIDVWHDDVTVYALFDQQEQLIAACYFDLYARQNKHAGAWMDDGQVRRRRKEGVQLPVAYVNCNFNGPTADAPALFKHDDVVTLFHEFGHALQHMLTKIEYADLSGIHGIPWDAVEVASQFLENWAWQRESIHLIAKQYQTGAPLPDALFDKMNRAKHFQSAMQMVRQLEFALFDFELHLLFNPEDEQAVQKTLDTIRQRVTVVPVPAFNRFAHGFSHIFAGGYAAGYYSYKWAEVMAADAFGLFLEEGIFNKAVSEKFQRTFMECGGAQEPADLFEQFRGRAPQVQALLEQAGIKQ